MTATTCWCGARLTEYDLVCTASIYHDPLADGRPSQIQTLYVAGPMSGYDDCNYPAFHDASKRLIEAGFLVVNPADRDNIDRSHYVDILREDLRFILDCDGIATLEYWWESVGARNEVQVAGLLKMPVRSVDEWVDLGPISG